MNSFKRVRAFQIELELRDRINVEKKYRSLIWQKIGQCYFSGIKLVIRRTVLIK